MFLPVPPPGLFAIPYLHWYFSSASFPLLGSELSQGRWDQVASLSIAFEASGPTTSATTTAAVNWLVVRYYLNWSICVELLLNHG